MGVVCALLAFVFCLAGGVWILSKTGLDRGDQVMATGIGLYFICIVIFVGPMLLIMALKSNR